MSKEHLSLGGNCQALAMSGTSATSSRYQGVVNLTPTADCFVRQGPQAPTALVDVDQFLAANAIYSFFVDGYIAVITSGGAGTLYISPIG